MRNARSRLRRHVFSADRKMVGTTVLVCCVQCVVHRKATKIFAKCEYLPNVNGLRLVIVVGALALKIHLSLFSFDSWVSAVAWSVQLKVAAIWRIAIVCSLKSNRHLSIICFCFDVRSKRPCFWPKTEDHEPIVRRRVTVWTPVQCCSEVPQPTEGRECCVSRLMNSSS